MGNLGFNCNTMAFATWFLVSLVLATPISARLGSKMAIVLGLAFSCMQYLAFVICSALPDVWYMHAIAYGGADCVGVGAGLIWTAEGVFFAESAARVARASRAPLESTSAALASVFGLWSLGIECVIKLVGFVLEGLGVSTTLTFAMSLTLAIASTLAAGIWTSPVHSLLAKKPSQQSISSGAMSLWSDARIWLISFLTVDFFLAVALMNGIVSSEFVKPQLGKQYVALLSALVALSGALVQYPLRILAGRFDKGYIMAAASLLVMVIPGLMCALDMRSLGWWLAVFYVLLGVLRGVYVSTNKAVYADHFPEPKTEAAFANMCMQAALASAAAFFFEKRVPPSAIMIAMAGIAALIGPGYLAASRLQRGRTEEGTNSIGKAGEAKAEQKNDVESGGGGCASGSSTSSAGDRELHSAQFDHA